MSRILVVDDNALNLQLACDALEMAGYQTFSAMNGQEAIDMVLTVHPALVLMDLRMPVMNGKEAMQALKAMEQTRHIPIVVLTASAMVGEREKLLAIGFDGYISKPIDLATFANKVAEFLTKSS